MAINIIQIDTNRLNSTISDMDVNMNNMNTLINQIYSEIAELDGMWDGSANNAFNVQFQKDSEEFKRICNEISKFIDKMEFAKTEYNKCENKVDEIVRSIRI